MEILFEKGIPGFEEYKTFIINEIEGNEKLKMITSTEDSNVGFVAISPFEVKKDYEIDLNDEIINTLKIQQPEDVFLLNIITLGKTLENSTVNLKAPISNKYKQP